MDLLAQPLTLPCGAVLRNRIAKAAMTEGLADPHNHATERYERLYSRWSQGGAGLLITGNVAIDRRHLERPGNVAIHASEGFAALRAYAAAGTSGGNHLWMQINHPGRQSPALINPEPLAPSAVPLASPAYVPPRAITQEEIGDVIERFGRAAATAQATGFTGVQIHSAHGYLLSQFLSARVNRRDDQWGGSLENRARLLLAVVARVREAVGTDFPIAVKLNSSDFEQGGFAPEECCQVVQWLEAAGIDLLEISGGTYEAQKMSGNNQADDAPRESTLYREAYFMEYAQQVRAVLKKLPLMVTGGFRSREAMEEALNADLLHMIGVAKPLCVDPDAVRKLLAHEIDELPTNQRGLKLDLDELGPGPSEADIRAAQSGFMGWSIVQIMRLAENQSFDPSLTIYQASQAFQANERATAAALVQDDR